MVWSPDFDTDVSLPTPGAYPADEWKAQWAKTAAFQPQFSIRTVCSQWHMSLLHLKHSNDSNL